MEKVPAFASPRRPSLQPTKPDYGIWALKDSWSISEAGKLVCGRNPHDKIPGPQQYNRERRVIDIIDEAFEAAQKGKIRVVRSALLPIHLLIEPASFVRWALDAGLAVPEGLMTLAEQDAAPAVRAEALIKERVTTVAQTLWFLRPELTIDEIVTHAAMRALVSDAEALMTDKLRWVTEIRES